MGEQEYTPKVEHVICMNGGKGDNSYAKNSNMQRKVMSSARHIVEQSVREICTTFSSTRSLTVADLGCATGPNALLPATEIINIACQTWDRRTSPSFFIYLNDLPINDFNSIFRSISEIYDPLREDGRECFFAAVPGSFYGRLFPSQSLHFVHLSYALHWLSQVPNGLTGENGEVLNKGNICIGETSSDAVQNAYSEQFQKDFRAFLNARSEELMPGGNMVLTFLGSSLSNDPFKIIEVIGLSLAEMAKEGSIEESNFDKFNLPIHAASEEEIMEVVSEEGHFTLRNVEIVKTSWDAGREEDENSGRGCGRGEFVAKYLRAVMEPQLTPVFGEAIMDELFRRVGMRFTKLMDAEECYYYNIVVWLTRNGSSDPSHWKKKIKRNLKKREIIVLVSSTKHLD